MLRTGGGGGFFWRVLAGAGMMPEHRRERALAGADMALVPQGVLSTRGSWSLPSPPGLRSDRELIRRGGEGVCGIQHESSMHAWCGIQHGVAFSILRMHAWCGIQHGVAVWHSACMHGVAFSILRMSQACMVWHSA
jgi:hypothetical protein